jgi:hypothetical protein
MPTVYIRGKNVNKSNSCALELPVTSFSIPVSACVFVYLPLLKCALFGLIRLAVFLTMRKLLRHLEGHLNTEFNVANRQDISHTQSA